MLEVLSLTAFAGVCYLLLIAIPSLVEKITSAEFKKSYGRFWQNRPVFLRKILFLNHAKILV